MEGSKIEWTTNTWNPVTGCTQVSPGCDHCYAKEIAERYSGKAFPNRFEITLRPNKLRDPHRWAPSLVFVNSMSDLFHREIPLEYVGEIWATMLAADQHIYQVLTKRPHRMIKTLEDLGLPCPPHIWLGVSVENQKLAENRIPALLQTPAEIKWLSCEPLLGPLDLTPWLHGLSWIVDAGESGPGRRPAEYDWFRDIRDQCAASGVAYFHKQGNHARSGQDRYLDGITHDEYPALRHPALAGSTSETPVGEATQGGLFES